MLNYKKKICDNIFIIGKTFHIMTLQKNSQIKILTNLTT